MNQYCALCKSLLKKGTKSLAHFIPQSIGGTLKSFNVLCNDCNKKANDLFDKNIYENFKHFAIILNTHRDRGNHRSLSIISTSGERLLIKPNGIVSKENWLIRKGKEFIVYFENNNELERIKKKFFSRIAYTLGGIKNTDKTEISKDSFFNFQIPFFTGDEITQRGIVLIAYLFYMEEKRDFKFVDKIAEFIHGIYPGNLVFAYPFISISPERISDDKIYHSILLIGNSNQKKLICIVELFSTFRYKIILNKDYNGPHLYNHKTIDIFTGKLAENTQTYQEKDFKIPKVDIQITQEKFKDEFRKLKKIINRKLLKNLLGRKPLFDIENIPAGTIVSEKDIERLDDNTKFTIFEFKENRYI